MNQRVRTSEADVTLNELLSKEITKVRMYQDYYYVDTKKTYFYDETIYEVNKNNKDLKRTDFLDFALAVDNIHQLPTITPEEFRRRMKEN
ncbi:MAG: hypothetical protein LUF89_02155 [Ruminococcus sp.]|nr:hypothetical protein [Ruminococcus sp.]